MVQAAVHVEMCLGLVARAGFVAQQPAKAGVGHRPGRGQAVPDTGRLAPRDSLIFLRR